MSVFYFFDGRMLYAVVKPSFIIGSKIDPKVSTITHPTEYYLSKEQYNAIALVEKKGDRDHMYETKKISELAYSSGDKYRSAMLDLSIQAELKKKGIICSSPESIEAIKKNIVDHDTYRHKSYDINIGMGISKSQRYAIMSSGDDVLINMLAIADNEYHKNNLLDESNAYRECIEYLHGKVPNPIAYYDDDSSRAFDYTSRIMHTNTMTQSYLEVMRGSIPSGRLRPITHDTSLKRVFSCTSSEKIITRPLYSPSKKFIARSKFDTNRKIMAELRRETVTPSGTSYPFHGPNNFSGAMCTRFSESEKISGTSNGTTSFFWTGGTVPK
jgi:hypothetical protein